MMIPLPKKDGKMSAGPSIGVAAMEQDGTIILQLRAEDPGPKIGDALVKYHPGDPFYAKVLAHLRGLRPGERKPVPPWDE